MKMSYLAVVGAIIIFAAGCATSPRTTETANVKTSAPAQAQLLVISAVFGTTDAKFVDVTSRVNDLLNHSPHSFRVRPKKLLVDPAPGAKKTLVIIYEYNGQRHTLTTKSGSRVSLTSLESA
jgi:hypothetical protein